MSAIFFLTRRKAQKIVLLCYFFLAPLFLTFLPETCPADSRGIFEANKNSVVVVYSYDKDGAQIEQASGFIIREDGVVVTSYRAVSNAAVIKIRAGDTMLAVNGLLYTDRGNNIAVLKTEDTKLPAAKIRASGPGPEGEKIYLIGSPGEKDITVFEGTLKKIRQIAPGRNLLLITTPVTRGCDGGPVFGEDGEVIGLATFFTEGARSLYFALPVSGLSGSLSVKKVTPLHEAKLPPSENTPEYWFNLGAAYDSLGLLVSASGAYQKAVELKPEDAAAHNNLGVIYERLNIISFSIREHSEAIRLNPDCQEAYFNLGVAYTKSDRTEAALKAFSKAVELKPDDALAHNNLGVTFFNLGKFEEAIQSLRQAIRIKPDYYDAYYNLGAVYYQMDLTRDAIDMLQASIRLQPDIPKAHFGLGVIYSKADMASARKEYELLEKLDPVSARTLHELIEAGKSGPSEISGTPRDIGNDALSQAATPAASPKKIASPAPPLASPDESPAPPATAGTPEQVKIHEATAPVAPHTPKETASAAEPATPQDRNAPSRSDALRETGVSPASTAAETGTISDQQRPVKNGPILIKDTYSVQVSVFENKTNALSLVSRLRGKGYDAFLKIEHKANQNTRYRVLVGRFAQKAEALKISKRMLKKEKMQSFIFKQ